MSVDFLDFNSLFVESSSVLFRQSGIAARTDGVGSGSRTVADVCILVVKVNRILVLTPP
jgi:hypothetical protein